MKFIKWGTLILVLSLILSGCVSGPIEDIDAMEDGGAYQKDVDAEKSDDENKKEEDGDEKEESEKLKLLSAYKIEAETDNFEDDLKAIIDEIHDRGGYVSSNEISNSDNEISNMKRSSELALRVPRELITETIDSIKDVVFIKSESLDSVDMTDKYYNVEAKIEGLLVREDRLRSLYQESDNIKDILEIEKELSEVESIKDEEIRKKMKLDSRVQFARLNVHLSEVAKVNKESMSFKEELKDALSSTSSATMHVVVSILVLLMRVIPFVILGGVSYYIYKKYLKDLLSVSEDDKKDL